MFLPLIFVVVLILIGLPIYFRTRENQTQTNIAREMPDLNANLQRKIDNTNFTKTSWVKPLEKNQTGSIYSPKAQLRGTLTAYQNQGMAVLVGGEEKQIALPQNIRTYCTPEYYTDASGRTAKASEIWINFKNPESLGSVIDRSRLQQVVPAQSEMTVLVNVDTDANMTAYFVVGFGCSLAK